MKKKDREEIVKAKAEKLKAETRKLDAETAKAEAEALVAELAAEDKKRTAAAAGATDERNHVYPFHGIVDANSVNKCIAKTTEWSRLDPGCDIEIVFTSPGGGIIEGLSLFDHIQDLRSKGHKITTGSIGMAASMAGILLQAGDVRWIGQQSWLMIHRAAFGAQGKVFEIEDRVKWVSRIEKRIIKIFVSRSKLTKQEIKAKWDRKDWWIDAEEAKKLGLVDEIRGKMPEYK